MMDVQAWDSFGEAACGVVCEMGESPDAGKTERVLWWYADSVDSISSRTLGSVCGG